MFTIKKFILPLSLILIFSIAVHITPKVYAASYREGSRGTVVTQIQQKLINWGYMTGSADGIFGSKTTTAVKSFQSKNGLSVDGIVGTKTLSALGISTNSSSSSRDEELYLLARIISAEARGEPYEGQVAVGAVVLNRVRHPSFPNSIAGVIYQSGAFTAIVDGQFNEPIADSAWRAAQDALNGWDPSGGCIYYYNPVKSTSSWIFSRQTVTVIGSHRFAI